MIELQQFASYWQSLSHSEREHVGALFSSMTGAVLSPWVNPIPVVAGVIPIKAADGSVKVLAVRRSIEPDIGTLCLPCGYMDSGEDLQDAMLREVREETGLDLSNARFSLSSSVTTSRNRLVLFLVCDAMIPERVALDLCIACNTEVQEVVVVDPSELHWASHAKAAYDTISELSYPLTLIP